MRMFTYTITRDFGFAPNPFGGICTLATCKPLIRKNAKVGDWIIGTGSKTKKIAGRLLYAMIVDEILTFNEYWNDKRFQFKKPLFNGSQKQCWGDNIYFYDESSKKWHQQNSHHSLEGGIVNEKNLNTDTRWPIVLIARMFWYFGKSHIEIPNDFLSELCHNKRVPPYKIVDNKVANKAIDWIKKSYEQGVHDVSMEFDKGFKRYDGN